MHSWLFSVVLLGAATGLRTMTPIAVVCWFAYLKFLPIQGTWAFWTAALASVIVFTVFALGEYVGDKLPTTPNRTAPGPLGARLCFGGLVGAVVATGLHWSLVEGAVLGVVGALVGSFAGLVVRRELAKAVGKDWPVALAEDVFAVGCAVVALRMIVG
jgi:uncharacterized membrane protein